MCSLWKHRKHLSEKLQPSAKASAHIRSVIHEPQPPKKVDPIVPGTRHSGCLVLSWMGGSDLLPPLRCWLWMVMDFILLAEKRALERRRVSEVNGIFGMNSAVLKPEKGDGLMH